MVTYDENPRILNLPEDQVLETEPGQPFAVVSWTEPTTSDNSMDQIDLTSTRNSGDMFHIGSTVVTYTARDAYDNDESASFLIKVIDMEKPVFNYFPSNIKHQLLGETYTDIFWDEPSVTDNSGDVSLVSSHHSGDWFAIGRTIVDYKAFDSSGNTATKVFSVIITDDDYPVIHNVSNVTVNTDVGKSYAIVIWTEPTATDNYGVPTLTSTHKPGDRFNIGYTEVEYTANDISGHNVTASVWIEVQGLLLLTVFIIAFLMKTQ
ncbi:hyalin-like [Amphiura filiformis]|uniref:hyalin-like n=1 Tax=Amphiura filiformis TaxID=82378 RepID=UPI003B2218C0